MLGHNNIITLNVHLTVSLHFTRIFFAFKFNITKIFLHFSRTFCEWSDRDNKRKKNPVRRDESVDKDCAIFRNPAKL